MAAGVIQRRRACLAHSALLPPARYTETTRLNLYARLLADLMGQGVDPGELDGFLCTTLPDGSLSAREIAGYLGLKPRFINTSDAGGASSATMMYQAIKAVEENLCNVCLVASVGKFDRALKANQLLAHVCHPELEMPYRPGIFALYALFATAYCHHFKVDPVAFSEVSVATRAWALLHPLAIMRSRGRLRVSEVEASDLISTPLKRLHCSVPVGGGGAFLVATPEWARRHNCQPLYLRGFAMGQTHGYVYDVTDFTVTGASISGPRALKQAGCRIADVDFLQLYDAFAFCPLLLLEEIGWCAKGEAPALIRDLGIGPGGGLPLNTYGGLLSFGHPGMASGMMLVLEAMAQLRGEAKDRQVKGARRGLCHVYGGMLATHATVILEGE